MATKSSMMTKERISQIAYSLNSPYVKQNHIWVVPKIGVPFGTPNYEAP